MLTVVMPTQPCPPRPSGFSLIELALVMAIVGIAAAMAIPMLSETRTGRLRGAAQVLSADISAAQSESLAHADDTRVVVFDTTNHRYHLAPSSAASTPITHPMTRQPYRITFGAGSAAHLDGVTIESVSVGGDDRLGFGVYGNLDQATDATVTLGCEGAEIDLTIAADTGEVTIGTIQ